MHAIPLPRRRSRVHAVLALAAAALIVSPLAADVLRLKDGRTYEGEILRRDSLVVTIDTMVTPTIRTRLSFDVEEVEEIEDKPVPPGFFDPPPPTPEPRVSGQDTFGPEVTLYLEVPIVGTFGTDVFAAGIEDVLRYARRYRIKHLVFMIDSDGGGIDEAGKTYELLKKYDRAVECHAIIKRCTGDALAIPVWCDTVRLLPGAIVGGSMATMAGESASSDQEALVRSQIANEIERDMARRGREPLLVSAMIDPTESLAAWRGDDGEVTIAPLAPVGLPEDRIIFNVGANEILVLNEEQAVELGLPRFDGAAEDLGAQLEIESWSAESTYAYDAMGNRAMEERRRGTESRVKHAKNVERNIERRGYAERYIESALKNAAEWSPDPAAYQTYSVRWNWGWGGRRGRVSSGSTWSLESRTDWRNRSDTTIRYLREAARGITEAAKLDAEAVELGLEPTFKPGELELMADDVQTKYDQVMQNRDRMRR